MSDIREPFADTSETRPPRPHRHPPSLLWPLVLISAGVLLLLTTLGYLRWQSWAVLWQLWPLLLVALGIEVLIGRRSTLGAIVSGLLILALLGGAVAVVFFAQDIPILAGLTRTVEWQIGHVEHPLAGVERASVTIDWTSIPGYLGALGDSPNLIEGDIAYRGELIFDANVADGQADVELDSHFSGPWFGPFDLGEHAEARWDVRLSPEVPLDLVLDTGSGRCEFDLRDLQVENFVLDSGSGAVALTLPSESDSQARIESGSGAVTIALPEGVGARVVLESGSGAFDPGERFRLIEGEPDDDGVWETDDFDTAEYTAVLRIDQGSGAIRVE